MKRSAAHNDALDGLRFIAFLAVFLCHVELWDLGRYGVIVFFVLSGFLIGHILLVEKKAYRPLNAKLKTFYARRVLRIFPLYYFVLACFAVASLFAKHSLFAPHSLLVCALYVYNWWFIHAPIPTPLTHFWTLAVEEQFYLLAPLIVLTVPARTFLRGFALYLIALAGLHVWAFQRHWDQFINLNSFSNFAFLGLGIYLAYADEDQGWRWLSPQIIRRLGIACTALLVVYSVLYWQHPLPPTYWLRYAVAGASAWVIWDCWHHGLPTLCKLLAAKPLVQLGRISYGLYVYHWPIICIVAHHFAHRAVSIPVCFCLTVAVSAASWIVLERPALALKSYFPY